nr:endoribonuclease YbeY isoform X1 [Pan paniscus]
MWRPGRAELRGGRKRRPWRRPSPHAHRLAPGPRGPRCPLAPRKDLRRKHRLLPRHSALRTAGRKRRGPTSGSLSTTGFRPARCDPVPLPPTRSVAGLPVGRVRPLSRPLLGPDTGSVANIFKGLVILREMSLVIRNLQRVIPIRRAPLRSKIEIVRRILGVQKFDLGIICVDNKNIQHINRIYRDRNVPTDVLSFPFHEHLKAGEFPQPDFPDDYNLGDIFLGVEYIFHQCKENEDYNDILTVTATHGLCHLLGFTHGTEAEWQQMFQKEKAVLDELGRRTGTRLQPLTRGLFGGS